MLNWVKQSQIAMLYDDWEFDVYINTIIISTFEEMKYRSTSCTQLALDYLPTNSPTIYSQSLMLHLER